MAQINQITATQEQMDEIIAPFLSRGWTLKSLRNSIGTRVKATEKRNVKVYCYLLRKRTGISTYTIGKHLLTSFNTAERFIREVKSTDLIYYANLIEREIDARSK